MQGVAVDLERLGHSVVSSWIRETIDLAAERFVATSLATDAASRNLRELRAANLCVVFGTAAGREEDGRGGRHVEFGAALAWQIPVILIGRREHVFYSLAAAAYPSWDACRKDLHRTCVSSAA